MTTNDQARSRNSRKRRALLASGLVLGVGVVITLAAWNDSVWGSSDFGTGENS
ncbi:MULTISPECIES: SipW-dependent-type signal peptide-containing protein [Rhodococcus]|uniref:SipW-dependent-type signal peptide-containing protein n=1 Tax=Rhodococcus TaxID=1827 RepID=UPI001CF9074D|nr:MULTISPECIES: SipW-dependent-type signal peptide-containing protein [Rhodococcus]